MRIRSYAGILVVLSLLSSALLVANADAGGIRGALASFDVTPDEMIEVERYAERAATSRHPNEVVAWTTRNIVWHAQAWGGWTERAGSDRSCRQVVISGLVRSQEGRYRQDVTVPICTTQSARGGQRRLVDQGATER